MNNTSNNINDVKIVQLTNEVQELEHLRKLFVGGLAPNTTEEDLKQFYGQWGEIESVSVSRDPKTNRSRGFGFVTYLKSSYVDIAQSNRPHTINGKTVQSKRALLRSNDNADASITVNKLFIGGLKDNQDEECLREYFSKYGNITYIKILIDKVTGKRRGFAYVEFDDHDAVDKIILNKPHKIKDIPVDVKKSVYQGQTSRPQIDTNLNGMVVNKIFVGGLKNEHDEACLREYFTRFGNVLSINILTDKATGKRRGFAFVEFDNYDSVTKAILFKQHIIKNVQVDVKKSSYEQEMKNRQQLLAVSQMNLYLNMPSIPELAPTEYKIFVGGLKNHHDEICLRDYFSNFGTVLSVKILVDKATGKRRGFAYVGFLESEAMERALTQGKHFIKQVMVEVKKSHFDQDSKSHDQNKMDVLNGGVSASQALPLKNDPRLYMNNTNPMAARAQMFAQQPILATAGNRLQNFGFGYQQGFAGGPVKHNNNAPNPFRMNPYGPSGQAASVIPVGGKFRR